MATTDIYYVSGSLQPAKDAVKFLGGDTDDYIQVNAWAVARTAANDTAGTISAWIIGPAVGSATSVLCAGDDNVVEYIDFGINAGKVYCNCVDATTTQFQVISTSAVLKAHTWNHIAVVQDGNRPTLYANGVAVAMTDSDATALGAWFTGLDGLDTGRIGAGNIAGDASVTQEFKGAIGPVKYWNRALTADEIAKDYRGAPQTDDGTYLQSHWLMDELLSDDGLGNDSGTIVGAAVIQSNYNEFASKLNFSTGTPVVADTLKCFADKGVGHAVVIQAA